MDGPWRNPYVAPAMNLLLLLSALFSALTGAGMGVRRPEVTRSVAAQAVAAQPVRVATALVARRPVAALPTLVASAALDVPVIPAPIGKIDLWASRRRE